MVGTAEPKFVPPGFGSTKFVVALFVPVSEHAKDAPATKSSQPTRDQMFERPFARGWALAESRDRSRRSTPSDANCIFCTPFHQVMERKHCAPLVGQRRNAHPQIREIR